MYIKSVSQVHAAQGINSPHRAAAPASEPSFAARTSDQVDISPTAELINQVHNLPDIRADRVAELRAQISSGSYETEGKIDLALDRLLDEIA